MSKATELREQALQKFKDARALVDSNGNVPAEKLEAFNATMSDAMDTDKAYEQAAAAENLSVGRLDERLGAYTAEATGGPGMRFNRTPLDPAKSGSLGQQFVQSAEYARLREGNALESDSSPFNTGRVVLTPRVHQGRVPMGAAAGDTIQTESGGPGNALVLPQYLPGILGLPQRPLEIRDLFSSGQMTTGDTLSYAAQSGFDSGAASVAQSDAVDHATIGVKPQSSIAWERRTAAAEWIATYMVATRQALADAGVIASLIDNQGRLMLRLEEEDQLLAGNGTPPNLEGVQNVTGLQTLDLDTTNLDNLDGIRTARRMVKTGLSRMTADWIAINPEDSEEFDLLKDQNDLYRGGNPIGNFGFNQSIWSLQRVETEALTAGTALVGSRAGATVFERQPITVLTADQHSDFFIRNLIVVLFEERLAFPIFYPTAFVEITLDQWA